MSIARVVEITATSDQSFEDALEQGVARATQTLRNVRSAWVKEQEVQIENGRDLRLQGEHARHLRARRQRRARRGRRRRRACGQGGAARPAAERSRVSPQRADGLERGPLVALALASRRRLNLRHADDGSQHVFEPDAVARFEPVADRLRPDARRMRRTVRVVDVGEVHVPRDLPVDADWLHLAEDGVAGAFQHAGIITGWRRRAGGWQAVQTDVAGRVIAPTVSCSR